MRVMHDIHLASLDLNLLVALDALLSERNVTRAARRIGITQSAMSHSLSRLRELIGDPLLIRGGNAMVTTPRADALATPIRHALAEIVGALRPPRAFDPKTATASPRIATSDYGEVTLVPRLVSRLTEEAPAMNLRLSPFVDESGAALAAGAVDIVIAPVAARDDAPGIFVKKLFDETFVCVVRRGHPLSRKKLTLARYVAASHALISPRGNAGGFVEDALARLGMTRRVLVTVPHFLVAPHVVASSDLVLTVAARVAKLLAEPLGLELLTPPAELRLPGFRISMLWHARTQDDQALRWFRDLLASVATEERPTPSSPHRASERFD